MASSNGVFARVEYGKSALRSSSVMLAGSHNGCRTLPLQKRRFPCPRHKIAPLADGVIMRGRMWGKAKCLSYVSRWFRLFRKGPLERVGLLCLRQLRTACCRSGGVGMEKHRQPFRIPMKWGLRDGGRRIGALPALFACHAAPASARHCLLARRGVRDGLRSTIGNRVYPNPVPGVRISPSPPVFTLDTDREPDSLKAQGSLCLHLLCARVHTARAHRRSRMLPRCGRFRTGQPLWGSLGIPPPPPNKTASAIGSAGRLALGRAGRLTRESFSIGCGGLAKCWVLLRQGSCRAHAECCLKVRGCCFLRRRYGFHA